LEPKDKFPKGPSFISAGESPLIINKCERTLSFAPLDPSKLIHYIAHPDVLLTAYELIKSKPGNMTKGATPVTLDGVGHEWIKDTSKKLLAGQYKFGVARRILIPKPGKTGERPITMASPREKVVQKAIDLVLQELFERQFMETSHGFRPKRGCHTALQMVDRTFRGGTWVIEADLTKCFDTIPHSTLMSVLARHIKCGKTLSLIRSGLKAGYILNGKSYVEGKIGTPQGSVLSPLLCNIYLHALDVFMNNLIGKHTVGDDRRKNPAYRKFQYQIAKAKDNEVKTSLRRQMWKVPSKDLMDPNFRRLAYVRYADDFVICVTGPYKLAQEILNEVRAFIETNLGLKMNNDKTKITKFSKGINFLGTTISNRKVAEKKIALMNIGKSKGTKVRITPRLSFHAPITKLIERLTLRGYYR